MTGIHSDRNGERWTVKGLNLDRKQQRQPAEHERRCHHAAEHLRSDDDLFPSMLAQQSREHCRHGERKDQHEQKMAVHYFRPLEISNASITTSVFRRPATMRKVLPYS